MTSTRQSLHVGTRPTGYRSWERTQITFHNFRSLPSTSTDTDTANAEFNEKWVSSPEFSCLGHKWEVRVAPRGFFDSNTSTINLMHLEGDDIGIEYFFAIKNSDDKRVDSSPPKTTTFEEEQDEGEAFSRPFILNNLVNGALVIEVVMKHSVNPTRPFIPENPCKCEAIRNLFMDEESANVVFELDKFQSNNTLREKKPKTEPIRFYAHTLILKSAAPLLAELCKLNSNESRCTIHIPNVSANAFNVLLCYIYGHDVPYSQLSEYQINDAIKVADKYGLIKLKLEAEAWYVASTKITIDNVMENLHLADTMNCALLREAVMDFIVRRKDEIVVRNTLAGAPEGLVNDILAAVARRERKQGIGDDDDNFNAMCISALRRRAHSLRLDVDGSREMLITSLLEDKKRRVTEMNELIKKRAEQLGII